jgi:hypothetical protein
VQVSTELTITGKVSQFGRGMIEEVSARLLRQFSDNLEERLADRPDTATFAAPTGPHAPDGDVEPLDVLALTRGPLVKRALPLAVAAAVALALTRIVIGRRRRG